MIHWPRIPDPTNGKGASRLVQMDFLGKRKLVFYGTSKTSFNIPIKFMGLVLFTYMYGWFFLGNIGKYTRQPWMLWLGSYRSLKRRFCQETFCHLQGIVPDAPRWDKNLSNFKEAAQNQMWPRAKETKPRLRLVVEFPTHLGKICAKVKTNIGFH